MLASVKYVQPLLRAASTGAAAALSVGGGAPTESSRRYCRTTRSRISHTSSPLLLRISGPRLHNHHQKHPYAKSNKIGPFVALFSTTKSSSSSDTTIQPELAPSENQEFASSYHAPVMYKECIDAMLKRSHNDTTSKVTEQEAEQSRDESTEIREDPNRPKIYVDGTLGGGGHSLCLLQNLSPGDILIGCDVDPSALATASTRLKDYIVSEGGDGDDRHDDEKPIFIPVQSNFRDLYDNVRDLRHPVSGELLLHRKGSDGETSFVGADAILLDLGVSSHQIDNADRGFAYRKDGPLDMRMWGGEWNNQDGDGNGNGEEGASGFDFVRNKNNVGGGMTAAYICNQFGQEEIRRILKTYGEEPRANIIARSIVDARPLSTTDDLRKAVAKVTPIKFVERGNKIGRFVSIARVFQALRVVVNEEDIVLRDALEIMAPSLIRKGGRLVVLSYQSLEDRATEKVMRDGSISRSKRNMFGNEITYGDGTTRPWKPLGKRARPTKAEVKANSRARSAVLRVAERL